MKSVGTQPTDTVQPPEDAQVERSARMFDPYLTSTHPIVTTLAANLADSCELLSANRQRKMKARDRENLNAMVHAVLANLARMIAEGANPPTVGVSLRAARQKTTRYDRRGFTGLPALLETLSNSGSGILLSKSYRKGTASAISVDPALGDALRRFKFRPEHFGQAEGRETIWLARTQRDYVDNSTEREEIDYADTPETERYRAEMQTINSALRNADIRMEPSEGPLVLTSLRELRRCFNLPGGSPEGMERFDLGGRLFGGWWENLPSNRRDMIRINREPVADLDFASMFLRLAYLEAGVRPPEGDLYAVSGLSEARWRDGVKKTVSAMLFRVGPLTRLPKDVKALLPPRASGGQVRTAIVTAHPALAQVFETGIGLRLMFLESQIIVGALLRLAGKSVPVLPMHDGLMVPRLKTDMAAKAMGDASEEITGFRLPITLKAFYK